MRILFDTNIILDIALGREPFFIDSADVFKKIDNDVIYGFITATTITDIYYIAKKEKGHAIAIAFISNLIDVIDVLGIDKEIIIESLLSPFNDFEDAIQSISSRLNNIDYIITRNQKDFADSEIIAVGPKEFLSILKKKKSR
jgi:predicted nucleic acid-binding protein